MKHSIHMLIIAGLIVSPAVICGADDVAPATQQSANNEQVSWIMSVTADAVAAIKDRALALKDAAVTKSKVVCASPKSFAAALISKKTAHDTLDRVVNSDFMKYWAIGFAAARFNNGANRSVSMFNPFAKIHGRYYLLGLAGVGYQYLSAAYENAFNASDDVQGDDQVQADAQPAKKCTKCTSSGCKGGRCGK